MINFFKKKQPKITFWSSVPGLADIQPVEVATKYIPSWFAKTPRFTMDGEEKLPTVKNCPSFPDFHRIGYVMKMWCDSRLTIKTLNDGEVVYNWETPNDKLPWRFHGDNQFIDHLPANQRDTYKFCWKTECPWFVKTPPGVSMLQMPMFYEFNEDFEVLPGIIDTDFHYEINQQVMVKKEGTIEIKRGTPLCMYIPFQRNEFEFECIDETPEFEKERKTSALNIFTKFNGLNGGYKEKQKQMRKDGEYKCPFHKK